MNSNTFELSKIQELLGTPLDLEINPAWASDVADHRLALRTAVQNKFQSDDSVFLSFEKPLTCFQNQFISISHSLEAGVFITSPAPVGVDLEKTERIKPAVVRRVSSEEEVHLAPSSADLWTAKEAIFKALAHFSQPPVMSQIEINSWEKLAENVSKFSLKNPKNFHAPAGKGLTIKSHSSTLAVFVFYP